MANILFVSTKISQAQIKCERMENLDATGHNDMFGDDDINFDLELESFGVEMGPLREPAVECVFRAWVEDWEEEAQKKNDCVAEAQLLAKYKSLVVRDPNSEKSFSIWEQNMEFRRGRGNGWFLVAVCLALFPIITRSIYFLSSHINCYTDSTVIHAPPDYIIQPR